jgi:hypothetical protein
MIGDMGRNGHILWPQGSDSTRFDGAKKVATSVEGHIEPLDQSQSYRRSNRGSVSPWPPGREAGYLHKKACLFPLDDELRHFAIIEFIHLGPDDLIGFVALSGNQYHIIA